MLAISVIRYRIFPLVIFALVWAFLMPTIEKVVTPVSSSMPAVSSGVSGTVSVSIPGKDPDKPHKLVVCIIPLIVGRYVRQVTSIPRFRTSIPLIIKNLLLRPMKFTSNYVGARIVLGGRMA